MDFTDSYRIFYPNTKEHIFYSAAHGSFSKTDHFLRHNTNLYKFKKIEIVPCILSDYNVIKLKIDRKFKTKHKQNPLVSKKNP